MASLAFAPSIRASVTILHPPCLSPGVGSDKVVLLPTPFRSGVCFLLLFADLAVFVFLLISFFCLFFL